jgi:hypothetical protein
MEILDPKQPGKNVGQAGNELGYLIAGFCRNILTSFNLEDFLRKGELKDHTSYHPQIFPASVLATPSGLNFDKFLRSGKFVSFLLLIWLVC